MSKQPSGEIILYQRGDAPAIDVRLDGDTVWLSLNQIADLLGRDKSTISRHIANVFAEGELERAAVVAEIATTAADGKTYRVEHFNLDVVISVGYRVKSRQGTQFRIWATERLREYLVKGFAMDDARLKNLGGGIYWKELLDRIRDIRSSEKVLYRQVLDLYATSVDYDPKAEASLLFFKTVQNKLHYAAHGQTAAEVIAQRADAGKPFMGLLSFSGTQPTMAEVGNAKNYLDANELKRLNTLVSAYFDAAEFRAMNHEPTYMKDWLAHLTQLITAMGGQTLQGAGKVSHHNALAHAEAEYAKFRAKQAVQPSDVEAVFLETVKKVQKKIEGKNTPAPSSKKGQRDA
ncbi:MAG: virulence RhuM family protein [Proteobacteria bacterium]|nr:virulence RhuM family protein [Pseudomonadota bacterium]